MKVASDVFLAGLMKYVREHVVDIEQHSNIGTMDELGHVFISALSRMATPDVRIVNVNCDFTYGYGNAILLVSKGMGIDGMLEGTAQLITNGGAIIYGYTCDESLHGAWYPITWEYANPNYIANETYRTSERFNGEPVYAKLVDFGDFPVNGSTSYMIALYGKTLNDIIPIEIRGVAYSDDTAFSLDGNEDCASFKLVNTPEEHSTRLAITSLKDMSGYRGHCIVKWIEK